MTSTRYNLKSDGELIAVVVGGSRGGYSITFAAHPERTHMQRASRVRDLLPYVRALANIWSESELIVEKQP